MAPAGASRSWRAASLSSVVGIALEIDEPGLAALGDDAIEQRLGVVELLLAGVEPALLARELGDLGVRLPLDLAERRRHHRPQPGRERVGELVVRRRRRRVDEHDQVGRALLPAGDAMQRHHRRMLVGQKLGHVGVQLEPRGEPERHQHDREERAEQRQVVALGEADVPGEQRQRRPLARVIASRLLVGARGHGITVRGTTCRFISTRPISVTGTKCAM